jgi:DNA repair protein RadC
MKRKVQFEESAIAEIEMSYKPLVTVSKLPQIQSSSDAYNLLLHTWDASKIEFVEHFKVMLMNRANRVLGVCTVCKGSSTGCIADPKLVFAVALKTNACNLIIAHNHPSGNLNPSKYDIALSLKIREGGKLLDIRVLDHLIISTEGYYSFADQGAM